MRERRGVLDVVQHVRAESSLGPDLLTEIGHINASGRCRKLDVLDQIHLHGFRDVADILNPLSVPSLRVIRGIGEYRDQGKDREDRDDDHQLQ